MPSLALPSKEVSKRMKKIRSRGTGIEKAMEQIMKKANITFETQPQIPGHPDYRIKDTTILIFCDSSFWHGRREKEISGEAFSINRKFWVDKLEKNRRRDIRVNRALRNMGWSVHRFWDTDIIQKPNKVTNRLLRIINEKA